MLPLGGVTTTTGAGSTRSAAVTTKLTTAPVGPVAWAMIGSGAVITGGVVSTTVTVKLEVDTLPVKSVAVTFTVVSPSAKVLPLGGVTTTTGAGSTRSAAVTTKLTTAPVAPAACAMIGSGTVMTGGVVSTTVTVKLDDDTLPVKSVAVTFTVVSPNAKVLPLGGVTTTTGAGSTRSAAVTTKLTTAPVGPVASVMIGSGTVMTGGVVSTTVTVKLDADTLPAKSVAVTFTVVSPSAKVLPLGGVTTSTGAGSTMSVAVTTKSTTAPVGPVASAMIGSGTVIIGTVVSTTVTVKLAIDTLPVKSVAVTFTVVSPSAKVLSLGGVTTTTGAGSTMSVAVTTKSTTAPVAPVASAMIGSGTVITGGVVSTTVTVKLEVDSLPAESVAVTFTVVSPSAKVLSPGGVTTTTGAGSTISAAVTTKFTTAPDGPVASATIGSGTVITGGVVSTTVTVKLDDDSLPSKSVAVTLTVVVPSGKTLPPGGVTTSTGAGSTMSVAVTTKSTTAPVGPVAWAMIGLGAVITGGVVSSTVTVKLEVDTLPVKSVAVTFTVVSPSSKVLPLGGVTTTTGAGSTISAALTTKFTTAPVGPVASVMIGSGTVITGGVVSTTCTVKLVVPVFPLKSLDEQITVVMPMGKMLPLAGVQVTGREPSTKSLAVGSVKITTAPVGEVASTPTMLAGVPLMAGGVVSTIVTVKLSLAVFPPTSEALTFTVVPPSGKVLPDGGLTTGMTEPWMASSAETSKVTGVSGAVASITMSSGRDSTGAMVSEKSLSTTLSAPNGLPAP